MREACTYRMCSLTYRMCSLTYWLLALIASAVAALATSMRERERERFIRNNLHKGERLVHAECVLLHIECVLLHTGYWYERGLWYVWFAQCTPYTLYCMSNVRHTFYTVCYVLNAALAAVVVHSRDVICLIYIIHPMPNIYHSPYA